MIITEKLKTALSKDSTRLPLASELGVSYSTLTRWVLYDNEKLATLKVIAAITKVTGMKQEEMFVETQTA